MKKDLCTSSDLKKIFPWLNPRTVIYWVERGLLRPAVDAAGRGSSRMYSFSNVMEIAFLAELLRRGIPFNIVKRIVGKEVYNDIIIHQLWDYVLWISEGIAKTGPAHKDFTFFYYYYSEKINKLLKNDIDFLFAPRRPTSILVISFCGLKNFVDRQIEELR